MDCRVPLWINRSSIHAGLQGLRYSDILERSEIRALLTGLDGRGAYLWAALLVYSSGGLVVCRSEREREMVCVKSKLKFASANCGSRVTWAYLKLARRDDWENHHQRNQILLLRRKIEHS